MDYQKMNIDASIPLWISLILAIASLSLSNVLIVKVVLALIIFYVGIKLSKKVEIEKFNEIHNSTRPKDGKKRINVGCGYWSYKNWINMDDDKEYKVKLVNFKKALPLKTNSIDEARVEMKIEFLDNPKFLLEEISRVCKKGATFTIFYSWTKFIEHKNFFDEDTFIWLDKSLLSSKHHTKAPKVDFKIERIVHVGGMWSWLFFLFPIKIWRNLWRSSVHEMGIKIRIV